MTCEVELFPKAFVATSVTVYVPVVVQTTDGFCEVDDAGFPPGKVQLHDVASGEEVLSSPAKFGLTEPYSLVSITPPYEEVIYNTLIDAVCNSPLVVEDTLVIIEYPVEMGTLPYVLGGDKLFGVRNRRYGRTVLGLYVYRPNKKYDMRADEFEALK